MDGRNYLPPHALGLRQDPRNAHHRGPPSTPPPAPVAQQAARMEERIEAQHREIQALLIDNQRLAANHVALKQELSSAKQELHHLSVAAASVKAETDVSVREVQEKSMKIEAEARSINGLNSELTRVRSHIEELTADRKGLTEKLKEVNDDLWRAHFELKQLPEIEAEIETMLREIERGRAAIDYEKKMHATNLEQSRVMEEYIISKTREIEELRAELANAEKRAMAAAAAAASAAPGSAYAADYGNPNYGYAVNSYATTPYVIQQAQGIADGIQHGHGTANDPHSLQQPHIHR